MHNSILLIQWGQTAHSMYAANPHSVNLFTGRRRAGVAKGNLTSFLWMWTISCSSHQFCLLAQYILFLVTYNICLVASAAVRQTHAAAKKEVIAAAVGRAGAVAIPSPPALTAKQKRQRPQPDDAPDSMDKATEDRQHAISQLGVTVTSPCARIRCPSPPRHRQHRPCPHHQCPHRRCYLTTQLLTKACVAFETFTKSSMFILENGKNV